MSATTTVDKDSEGKTVSTHAEPDTYDPLAVSSHPTPIDTSGPKMNTTVPPPPLSMKKKKFAAKQQKKMSKLLVLMRKGQIKRQARYTKTLKELRKRIGEEDFSALKIMCTVFYPEKKDEKGTVVQEAYNSLNYEALVKESKNFLTLRRERRMTGHETPDGKVYAPSRRRTSGSSSDRKAHKAKLKFIIDRGQKALDNKEEIAGTIKA